MGEIRDNVRKNLGYYLSLRGSSQKALADYLNVSQAAVTNWIKGKNAPDIEVVARICDFLHISVTDLFGTSDEDYTDHERQVLRRYREKPDLQKAVDILLGVEAEPPAE